MGAEQRGIEGASFTGAQDNKNDRVNNGGESNWITYYSYIRNSQFLILNSQFKKTSH